jgi:hypothetical protein
MHLIHVGACMQAMHLLCLLILKTAEKLWRRKNQEHPTLHILYTCGYIEVQQQNRRRINKQQYCYVA